MNEIITCTDVTVHNEKTLALKNVSFSVHAGEFLSIVGENGAGKSTLVKTILGILKPDSGKVETAPGVSGKIGYLPQQSSAQRNFPASVREVVLSGCIGSTGIFPFYTRANKARAAENMRLLGIDALASKNYRALSGGQQQRVLLARALCAAERILLLDEPAAGLDPVVTADLYATILHLCREHGMTVIMVSHDITAAMRLSDRILHLATSLRFLGTTAAYAKTPLCAAMTMGDETND